LVLRFATGLVGLPIVFAAIWYGGVWLAVLVLLAASVAISEFYRLLPPGAGPLSTALGVMWTIALVLGAQAASETGDFLITSLGIWVSGAFVALLWYVAFYRGRRHAVAIGYLLMGPIYVGFFLGHGLVLRDLGPFGDEGRNWLLLAVLVTFASDTGAYLVGRAVGRHAMAPSISPAKTWEGSVGGFVCAALVALALGQLLNFDVRLWQVAVTGAAVGVLAQCGDLLESKLKRLSETKDAGSIILGHGGVLDRLDSIVISIPAVYYLAAVVFKP
jgi:phosphatidate cytidylyltransferase